MSSATFAPRDVSLRAPSALNAAERDEMTAGGSVRVRAALPAMYQAFEHIQFELSEPPDGITLGESSVRPATAGFVVRSDGAKAAAGLRGNLIVIVSGERIPPAPRRPPPGARRRVPIGGLLAIAFEVIR